MRKLCARHLPRPGVGELFELGRTAGARSVVLVPSVGVDA
jgi:hypothetical protein